MRSYVIASVLLAIFAAGLIQSCSTSNFTPELSQTESGDILLADLGENLQVSRQTSATYIYYLRDGVGYSSLQRWDGITREGSGYWTVVSDGTLRYFRGPGGTLSELVSPAFTIPGNTSGVKVTLKTRFSGLTSGKAQITVNGGQTWTDLRTFTGSDATSFWGANRLLLPLPSNTTASAQTALLRFVMDTRTSPSGSWDIDSMSIYRTDVPVVTLFAPQSVAVVDGPIVGTKRITWSYPDTGARPNFFRVYSSASASSGFTALTDVGYATYNPMTGKFTVPIGSSTVYYRITANRTGYPESAPSSVVSVSP